MNILDKYVNKYEIQDEEVLKEVADLVNRFKEDDCPHLEECVRSVVLLHDEYINEGK